MFGFGRKDCFFLGWIALGQMSLSLDYKGETKNCLLKFLGFFDVVAAPWCMAKGTLEMIII